MFLGMCVINPRILLPFESAIPPHSETFMSAPIVTSKSVSVMFVHGAVTPPEDPRRGSRRSKCSRY